MRPSTLAHSNVIMEAAPQRGPHMVDALQLLDSLLADESITEIMINRHDRIYVERNGELEPSGLHFDAPEAMDTVVQTLLVRAGKEKLGADAKVIDGILPGGNRLNIALPPIAVDGPSISIRKFPQNPLTLERLVERGYVTTELAAFLKSAIRSHVNILIAGNASSGKTTLLNALSAYIGERQRVVTIEDIPELQLQQDNVVRLETGAFSYQKYTMRELVKNALRMRPDRIIIGEVRGSEAFDLLQAMNTGHRGCMSTIHANSPREALIRLEHMINTASLNLSPKYIRELVTAAVGLVIQTERAENGERRITHVTDVVGLEGETYTLQDIFTHDSMQYVAGTLSSRNPAVERALQEFKTSYGAPVISPADGFTA